MHTKKTVSKKLKYFKGILEETYEKNIKFLIFFKNYHLFRISF